MEALSLGLKFATGLRKGNTLTTLTKNHRFNHNEFEKGFTQSIIATSLTNIEEKHYSGDTYWH